MFEFVLTNGVLVVEIVIIFYVSIIYVYLFPFYKHFLYFSQWEEDDERADYRQNLQWLEECIDAMFETWYEKINQADPDVKRKVMIFVAFSFVVLVFSSTVIVVFQLYS